MKTGLSKPTAARLLAAGLLVPLLGTAIACSSSDADPQGSPEASATSTLSAPAPASASASGTSAAASPSGTPDGDGQAAADQSPQPAPEPTFSDVEKVFLEGKVPEGVDPNSVLQVGQERCDVLLSAKAADAEAVVSELITDPSAEVSEAIRSLCTDLLPELEAAALGFPDGIFAVGEQAPQGKEPSIAAGTYRAFAAVEGCSLSVFSTSGSLIGSYDGSVPVTVGAEAARVESSQCYSWFRS